MQKECFLCEMLNKHVSEVMEAFIQLQASVSVWSWDAEVGPLSVGKMHVFRPNWQCRFSSVKAASRKSRREKEDDNTLYWGEPARMYHLTSLVVSCQLQQTGVQVFDCLCEDKMREDEMWRCKVAGISQQNQHVLAPSDFLPSLSSPGSFLPHIHTHQCTQPPHLQHSTTSPCRTYWA